MVIASQSPRGGVSPVRAWQPADVGGVCAADFATALQAHRSALERYLEDRLERQRSLERYLEEWSHRQGRLLEQALVASSETRAKHDSEDWTQAIATLAPVTPDSPALSPHNGNQNSTVPTDVHPEFKPSQSFSMLAGTWRDVSDFEFHNESLQDMQTEAASKVDQMHVGLEKALEGDVNEHDSPLFQRLERFESSSCWHSVCSIVIVANTVFLAYTADWYMKHLDMDRNSTLETIELSFGVFYMFELMIRIAVERSLFLLGPNWCFNGLDIVLVGITILEQSGGAAFNLSYLRMLRLMKMGKIMRAVRTMPAFHEVSLVMDSILGSASTMLCVLCLLCAVALMFGICFVQAVTENLKSENGLRGAEKDRMLEYWGSVPQAMLTLYMSTTGGADWGEMAEPLRLVGIGFYGLFCGYVAFFIFVLANTITSIFVESVASYAKNDAKEIIQEQLDERQELMQTLTAIFRKVDNDVSGDVSFREFETAMGDKRMTAFAAGLGLDITDLRQFFAVLSGQGQHRVDVESFVTGCIKLQGTARSSDLVELAMNQRLSDTKRSAFEKRCSEELAELRRLWGAALPKTTSVLSVNALGDPKALLRPSKHEMIPV